MTKYHWNPRRPVDSVWYAVGLLGGIGYLAGIVYIFLSDSKNKRFSLLYLFGVLGSILLMWKFEGVDRRFTDLSYKLLLGSVATTVFLVSIFLI